MPDSPEKAPTSPAEPGPGDVRVTLDAAAAAVGVSARHFRRRWGPHLPPGSLDEGGGRGRVGTITLAGHTAAVIAVDERSARPVERDDDGRPADPQQRKLLAQAIREERRNDVEAGFLVDARRLDAAMRSANAAMRNAGAMIERRHPGAGEEFNEAVDVWADAMRSALRDRPDADGDAAVAEGSDR